MEANNSILKPKNDHFPNTTPTTNYSLNGKIMLCSVIILFVAVLVIVCFHGYARWFFNRRRRRGEQTRLSSLAGNGAIINGVAASDGLDVSVLKSLVTFVYSKSRKEESRPQPPLECAVCLSEFEDGQEGRVLPKCGHIFHTDCIGVWFQSHSNCPLCRAPVQALQPVLDVPEIFLTVVEHGRSEVELARKDESEMGCCSSSGLTESAGLSPLKRQGKALELAAMQVESALALRDQRVRSLEDLGSGSTRCQGTEPKSPVIVSRSFTLKRIWSI